MNITEFIENKIYLNYETRSKMDDLRKNFPKNHSDQNQNVFFTQADISDKSLNFKYIL